MLVEGEFRCNDYSFAGKFNLDELTGIGRIVYQNKDMYEGNIIEGKYDGLGKLALTTGEIYEGEFKNNELNGEGKYSNSEGHCYWGGFANNLYDGIGELRIQGIEIYQGEWKNGQQNGEGQVTEGNFFYKGMYVDGKRKGFGLEKTDRWEYIGEFADNKYHGEGIYRRDEYNAQGTFRYGVLINGLMMYKNGDKVEVKYDDSLKLIKARKQQLDGSEYIGVWNNYEIEGICSQIKDEIWQEREKLQLAERENEQISILKEKYKELMSRVEEVKAEFSREVDEYEVKHKECLNLKIPFEQYTKQLEIELQIQNKMLETDNQYKLKYGANWNSSEFKEFVSKKCVEIDALEEQIKSYALKLEEMSKFRSETVKDLFSFLEIKLELHLHQIISVIKSSSLEYADMTVYELFFELDQITSSIPELTEPKIEQLISKIDGLLDDTKSKRFGQTAEQQAILEQAQQFSSSLDEIMQFNLTAQDKIEEISETADRLYDNYREEVRDKMVDANLGKRITITTGVL